MYEPRRISDVAPDSPETEVEAAAFMTGPRRATRTRAELFRTRVAPAAVSVALLATSGAVALNLNAGQSPATAAVPAPERAEDAVSRDLSRELLETETPVEEAAAEEATVEEATAADGVGSDAFVGGGWAAAFGAPAGSQFAQTDMVIRAQASASSAEIGSVKRGAKVSVTDKIVDGFRQVTRDGKVGYVAADQLGDTAPAKPTPPPAPKAEPKPAAPAAPVKKAAPAPVVAVAKAQPVAVPKKAEAPARTLTKPAAAPAAKVEVVSPAALPAAGRSVLGLKPKAMVVYNAVTAKWSFKSIGGYRASNNRSNHGRGGAIDFMITPGAESAKGWAVANYLAQNMDALGIDHIIFEQKIYTSFNRRWRGMENRGSTTANHYDHVHVSVAGI